MSKLRHINISDIHISPYSNPSDYTKELWQIIDYIDKIKEDINILTIAGDLFEKVYPANSPAIKLAVEFIRTLYMRAKAYKFIIFLVKGTESHDSSQLEIFKGMECEGLFYIIRDVAFFDIKGLLFRFIPEYYCNSYEELQEKAFSTRTDVTVYHGGIEGAIYHIKNDMEDNGLKKSQVITKNDLLETTNLYAVCGHIHNRINVAKNIWYTGSYTSKTFSDAGTIKGFDDITIDLNTMTYDVKFIQNKLATKFEIVNATDIFSKPMSAIKAYFNEMKLDLDRNTKMRVDVNASKFSEDQLNTLNLIISSYRSSFSFNVERDVLKKENTSSILADAEFVLDNNISIFDKIRRVIEEEYDFEIEVSRIKDLLDIPIEEAKNSNQETDK